MDVGLLKAFLEVYRCRHFGHAADNLFISPSAVSARIKQLEDELGIRLFTRDRNNIDLTSAGKKFLAYAENILNTWHRAKQDIAIPEGTDSLLNIAAIPSIWDMFLENWLIWLHQRKTTSAIQTDVMSSDLLIRNILDGSLDLGFVFDPPETPLILVKELLPVPLIMVSTQPGISAALAVKENYLYVDWGTSFSMIHARLYPQMPPPKLRATVGRIALGFLNNCGGSAYLPEAMVSAYLESSLFKVDDAKVIHKNSYAIYSQKSSKLGLMDEILIWFDQSPEPLSENPGRAV
jgi:DNA-binding transcriptional LysR family regulator